jgi:hypothetical protein
MPESPLSIAASVTSFLTFIAAILGFLYVRYITVQNSQEEFHRILESIIASLQETSGVASIKEKIERGEGISDVLRSGLEEVESADNQLKTLKISLYGLEVRILMEMSRSMDMVPDTEALIIPKDDDEKVHQEEVLFNILDTIIPWLHRHGPPVVGSTSVSSDRIINSSLAVYFEVLKTIFAGSRFGMRWYKVRNQVLKLALERDALRSRLSFHHLQMINM